MTGSTPRDPVAAFYAGDSDHRGRTLDGILAWSDEKLESVHDYIQWIFPTRQPSGVNPYAPLVTHATVEAFASDAALRQRLRDAFERMLRFYGLRESGGTIEPDPDRYALRSRVWLHAGNHNHLRLTRIMESVATLGLRRDALALQRCLVERVAPESGRVSSTTLEFWKRAVE